MSQVAVQSPYNEYTANGATTVFPYTFQALRSTDIVVQVDGFTVTNYSVSGVGTQAGGNVTFTTAPAADSTVLIKRVIPLKRDTEYTRNGDFDAPTVNQDLNLLWHAVQGLDSEKVGVMRAPYPETIDDLPAAADRAGYYLAFNAEGDPTPASGTGADAGLRTDLAASSGSSLSGFVSGIAGATPITTQKKLRDIVSISEFADLDDAVAKVGASAAIWLPVGAHGPLSDPLTTGVHLIGARKPTINGAGTALENGSIVKGPVIYLADGCTFENLGVDSGSDVCTALYGGVAQEGLICTVTYGSGTYTNNCVRDVVTLCKDAVGAVHAFAAEMQVQMDVRGLTTYKGLYGAVFKCALSNVSHVRAVGAGSRAIYLKRDESSNCNTSNFSNLVMDCQGVTLVGLCVESRRGDDGVTPGNLYQVNVDNFVVMNSAGDGVVIQGASVNTDTVSDCVISNGTIYSSAAKGVHRIGNTVRVKLVNVRALANGTYGFYSADTRSVDDEIESCHAVDCANDGFYMQGVGVKLKGNHAEDCVGYSYYLAGVSAVYRAGNSSKNAGSGDFGGDGTSYWHELNSVFKTDMQAPAFQNAWVDFGAPWAPVKFFKTSDGMVHLSGTMKNGALGAAAFVLPAGFKPGTNKYRSYLVRGIQAGTNTPTYVTVFDNGTVQVEAGGATDFVSLDGICFASDDADPV